MTCSKLQKVIKVGRSEFNYYNCHISHFIFYWPGARGPNIPPFLQVSKSERLKIYLFNIFDNTHIPQMLCLNPPRKRDLGTKVQLSLSLWHKSTQQQSQNLFSLCWIHFLFCIPLSLKCFFFSHFTSEQYLISLPQFFRYTMLTLLIFCAVFQERLLPNTHF